MAAKPLNMLTTLKGSLLEGFYPRGWDLSRIDRCCAMSLKELTRPAKYWSPQFRPTTVKTVAEMDQRMGHAIADEIERSANARAGTGDHPSRGADGDVRACCPAIETFQDILFACNDIQHG